MPAFRNIRRSRRISRQPPRDPSEFPCLIHITSSSPTCDHEQYTDPTRFGIGTDECDIYDLNLLYPESPSASPSPTTPAAPLSPADDAGEPEVDPESPQLTPSQRALLTGARSSHSRKRDPTHIPRPPNAFMLFRSDLCTRITVERDHRQISRIAGIRWRALTPAERVPWQQLADEAKRQHALKYPGYKYTPVYRKDRGVKSKPKHDQAEKIRRCHKVARLMQRGFDGEALRKKLEKRGGDGDDDDDDYSSDASEYVEAPRRKTARKPAPRKPSVASRPREPRHPKPEVKHEVKVELDEPVAMAIDHSPSVNASASNLAPSPEAVDVQAPALSDADVDDFVPTDEIPPFSLGEPAYNCEVRISVHRGKSRIG